jgi:RNA polymerase sigma factor (sigma-70 family)
VVDGRTLLAEYVQSGSEAAFGELLRRYIDLVYSTALRLVGGDTHLAEDVAQTVFIDLARKSGTLPSRVMIGGWLHRHTCFVASKTLRGERRRQRREEEAVEMNAQQDHSEANLAQVTPILDEAIDQLAEEDRLAILLRFYEQLDFQSVGEALNNTDEAARKRVTRALDKLQSLLKRRGVSFPAAALGLVLAEQAVAAAPAGLARTIIGLALANAATGGQLASSAIKFATDSSAKLYLMLALGTAGAAAVFVIENQADSQAGVHAAASKPLSRPKTEARAITNDPRLAAIVNGKPILASEVQEPMAGIGPLLRRQYAAQPDVLRQKLAQEWTNILETLINRELVVTRLSSARFADSQRRA